MIVTRTPLRISLFGGGTDYPEWYMRNRGAVIGLAINKYVYVTAMPLSKLHPYKFRLYWSKIERCDSYNEIEHPVVRAVLKMEDWRYPMGFSIIADLPARNGLGSSSAFTVGFLNALGIYSSKQDLANGAIYVERRLLDEHGGHQDQWLCALGGMNRLDFTDTGWEVNPVAATGIVNSLFLLHTGVARTASNVSAEQKYRTIDGLCDKQLIETLALVDEAYDVLQHQTKSTESMVNDISKIMHEAWRIKRTMSSQITNPRIDELYEECLRSGALAGKICGAGAGGFFLAIVPEHAQQCFLERMERRVPVIRVGLDTQGSIVWPEPSQQAI